MKVVLTRGLHIDRHFYPPGEQDIPVETLKSKQFAKHIKAGNILEPSMAPRKTVHLTPAKRAEVLLEKVYGKAKANLTPEEAEKASGGVKSAEAAPVADSAPAAEASEAAPQPKAGKKK